MSGSEPISPTAHYTGYVWARNGLSHPELETLEGRVLFESLRPAMTLSRALGGGSLESYLLARHRAIDALLERAIEERGVTQVIEVACGLSPRGWRFTERYGERLTYVESRPARDGGAQARGAGADGVAVRAPPGRGGRRAAATTGPESLAALAAELDPGQGLAIITEGLLGYLPSDAVEGLWRRFAPRCAAFHAGVYISDLHIGEVQTAQVRAFRVLLSAFVRGRVHLHFQTPDEAATRCGTAGFADAARSPGRRARAGDPRTRKRPGAYT